MTTLESLSCLHFQFFTIPAEIDGNLPLGPDNELDMRFLVAKKRPAFDQIISRLDIEKFAEEAGITMSASPLKQMMLIAVSR